VEAPNQSGMRVTQIEVRVRSRPPSPDPIRDALQTLPGAGSVETLVHTDEGLTGRGDAYFGRVAGGPAALGSVIEQVLVPMVVGRDPALVRAIHDDLLRETEYCGMAGLAMFGISCLDIALWDLLGKAAGWPVHRLLGARWDRIPAYAMVGWLNYSDDAVKVVCAQAVEQGFRAVKIKVGYPTLEEDAQRVETVRAAVGRETAVMLDANQSLALPEALRRGRVFQELGCLWFEEPLPAEDFAGYAELAAALDIPIAAGENLYGARPFADLIARRAVDVVQGDLRRAGGATSVLQIAAVADAFRLPYASHGDGAVNLNLLASMPNACWLETGLLSAASPLRLEGGKALVPSGPGFAW
jgi:L-alanine-DL-glutamate epimerase-like enolase superfamily enzyme